MDKVGVIGLGYIGLPLVAALALGGRTVVGLDVDQTKIDLLNRGGKPYLFEPGLEQALADSHRRLSFTTSQAELMGACTTVFICVGTPTAEDGTADLASLSVAVDSLGAELRPGHLIVLRSTVAPGTTRAVAKQLERLSGLSADSDFGVAFCPERTVEGNAIAELRSLTKIVAGYSPESAARAAEQVGILGGEVITVSSPEVAELSKLAGNVYRAAEIALANEFSDICERLGVNVDELTQASNAGYTRTRFLRGGLGADGPCLTKDPEILLSWTRGMGLETPLLVSALTKNKLTTLRPADLVARFVSDRGLSNAHVAVAGVTFKGSPRTDDTRDSAAEKIVRALSSDVSGVSFAYCDPVVDSFNGSAVTDKLSDAVKGANVVLLLGDHVEFDGTKVEDLLATTARPLLIVDCWRKTEPLDGASPLGDDVELVRIGEAAA
jgi:UDP-N-acetyl-D-mannosaminuronic acid dehydrogenase